MLKYFIRLLIILTVIAVVFVFNITDILKTLTRGDFNTDPLASPFNVPFILVKHQLNKIPQSQWQNKIDELQQHYDYPLRLKKIDDLKLNESEQHQLLENNVLAVLKDESNYTESYWLSTIENSELIIQLYMSDPVQVAINKENNGIFYSVMSYMRSVPETKWQQQFKYFREKYGVSIERIAISDLEIEPQQLMKLQQGNIITHESDRLTFMFYKKISNSDYVLKLKPYGNMDSNIFIINYYQFILPIMLACLLALALLLWMRPIWRDFNILNQVTTRFGQGDFQSRSKLSKRSAIWSLSESFNSMATRISNLIISHQDLTNAVSHELRTPLARLRFAVEIFNEETNENIKQRFIDSMATDIAELELLVSEMLTHARFERENPELKYCELNISKWLNELIEKIKSENLKINLQLIDSGGNENILMYIDPKLLDRVMNNLIRNAIRYAQTRVDICLTIKNNYCCISVDDDGQGIPEQQRERMMQQFTRLDSSRNKDSGGYGLGLSIVQQIIKWHHGKIEILSSRYGGASITINLPLEEPIN